MDERDSLKTKKMCFKKKRQLGRYMQTEENKRACQKKMQKKKREEGWGS